MAYDVDLAAKIRGLLGPRPDLTEKKMFGGLAFLINGNLAIAASGQGGLLVRVDPAKAPELLASTKAKTMIMRGREMPGWLRVSPDGLSNKDISFWVDFSAAYADSLPAKPKKQRRL